MISVEKALIRIDRETIKLGREKVPLVHSVGRVLAEDIVADMDLPPFDRSQMDGFAVRAKDVKDAPVVLTIVGESAAGKGWHKKLKSGEAVRIMTGAPVPEGADSVQKIELTREDRANGKQAAGLRETAISNGEDVLEFELEAEAEEPLELWETAASSLVSNDLITEPVPPADDDRELDEVEILESVEKGRFIVAKGSEIKRGDKVVRAGTIISPNMIAVLAAFGYSKVKVSQPPRVAVLSTGSEIVDVNEKPRKDQIRNSNSPMLAAFLSNLGIETHVQPIARDDIEELKAQINQAAESADLVIITGGVSVGKYDLTKAALKELGAKIYFERVELKPGKPTVFGRLDKTLVFGLPGNPVSSAVTFYLFVRRALLLMQQANQPDLAGGFAVLEAPAKGTKERDTYLPAALATDPEGRILAVPLKWHGSSDFIGFSRADALIAIPKGNNYEAGDIVNVLFLER